MTAIITNLFRHQNLLTTLRNIDSEEDSYYLGIGRSESWENDSLPPIPSLAPIDDIQSRLGLQSIKKISNIVNCTLRNNWTVGNTYIAYDDADDTLSTKPYYVLNPSNFNVYICLRAGAGASTVEPTGIDDNGDGIAGSVAPTLKADGYVWKYLYTISAANADRFLTSDFMPVYRNADVASNTIRGEIWNIDITDGGSGYTSVPTVVIEGDGSGAAATATLTDGVITSVTVTNVGSAYTFARIVISGGGASTPCALRPIISPQAIGREIVGINVGFGGTSYTNGALNLIVEGDGIGAQITATVTSGVVQPDPNIDDAGFRYTGATIRPETTTAGDDATFEVELSGIVGGFGYDPIFDLNAYYLMFNILLDGAEGSGDFIPGNNYRQLMIIKNPLDSVAPQRLFTEETGSALKSLIVNAGGTWVQDDIIVGGTSNARAFVDFYDATTETLYYHQTQETGFEEFVDGETLTGSSTSSGAVSALAGSASNEAEIDPFSGRIVYLENRVPVSRAPDQTEDIKLVARY